MIRRLLSLLGGKAPLKRSPESQQQVDAATQGLALYHFRACPHCARVERVIKRLGLRIERRDAHQPVYQQELRLQGGRYQTPCLRIETGSGEARWLYESAEIIRYLEHRFPPP